MRKANKLKIKFKKYQALGNDFVIIDCRKKRIRISKKIVKKICNRKKGVGCDQLIIIHRSYKADLKIIIFNQNGSKAKMCGNGIRAVAMFFRKKHSKIETDSGIIQCNLFSNQVVGCDIRIRSVNKISKFKYIVDVGNLHLVQLVKDIYKIKKPNNDSKYNVEFVSIKNNKKNTSVFARVFERGVGETKACGTGAAAIALAVSSKKNEIIFIHFSGGAAKIKLMHNRNIAQLISKVEFVFSGILKL